MRFKNPIHCLNEASSVCQVVPVKQKYLCELLGLELKFEDCPTDNLLGICHREAGNIYWYTNGGDPRPKVVAEAFCRALTGRFVANE